MALGKRKHESQLAWVATTDLPVSPGHPFYQKLNRLLGEARFDEYVEGLCDLSTPTGSVVRGYRRGSTSACCSWDTSRVLIYSV